MKPKWNHEASGVTSNRSEKHPLYLYNNASRDVSRTARPPHCSATRGKPSMLDPSASHAPAGIEIVRRRELIQRYKFQFVLAATSGLMRLQARQRNNCKQTSCRILLAAHPRAPNTCKLVTQRSNTLERGMRTFENHCNAFAATGSDLGTTYGYRNFGVCGCQTLQSNGTKPR